MYGGSVSTFGDLSVALGAASCYVQPGRAKALAGCHVTTPELAQVHVTDPASPHCPPKQRSKFKFLQGEDIPVKQLVAVCRVCVCADAAKNDYLYGIIVWRGCGGTCPYLRNFGG